MASLIHAAEDRLLGRVVKASASRAAVLGLIPTFGVNLFSRSSHTSDIKTGNLVAVLLGVGRDGVSAWTGWPGVSIL